MPGFKLRWLLVAIVCSLMFSVPILPLVTMDTVSANSSGDLAFTVGIIGILAGLFVAFGFLIACIGLAFEKLRPFSLIYIASAVSLFIGMLLGGSLSDRIRTHALAQLAERSKPLVTAIKNYDRKYGHPPGSLDALIPEFMSQIPTTGMGISPNYQYSSFTNGYCYGKNTWTLEVYSPGDVLSFDTFIYLPLEDYSVLAPDHKWDVQTIENWAYWHRG